MRAKPASDPLIHIELSIDQRQALKSAAVRLHSEFADTFDLGTIERLLYSSYDQLSGSATVHDFLALLAERFARQRIRALAKVQGKSTDRKPVVLFLCNHNAGRSQMAMGFFTHLAGGAAMAWSGGSEPQGEINPAVITVMAERGIDLANEYPKPWTDEVIEAADVIITMGCGDACPARPGRRHEEWDLDDPDGKEVAEVRQIRDEIEGRVRRLVSELAISSPVGSAQIPPPSVANKVAGVKHFSGGLARHPSKMGHRTEDQARDPSSPSDHSRVSWSAGRRLNRRVRRSRPSSPTGKTQASRMTGR